MLKELKENTDQEQKEIWKGIYEQSEISNKDIEFIKRTKQILRMEIYNWHLKKKKSARRVQQPVWAGWKNKSTNLKLG